MVELKIRRFGNSLGVVLPKEVIDRLQTIKGASIFLTEIDHGDYGSRRPILRLRRKWPKREKS
jgi:antitoxin component of MazEF toxin-antitoxin module